MILPVPASSRASGVSGGAREERQAARELGTFEGRAVSSRAPLRIWLMRLRVRMGGLLKRD